MKGSGIVYIIENEIGRVKIGITTNLKQRLRILETASGIRVTKQYSYYHENYREEEKRLHKKYKDFRTIGEWFDIGYYDVIDGIIPERKTDENSGGSEYITIKLDVIERAEEVKEVKRFIKMLKKVSVRNTIKTDTKNRCCRNWKELMDTLKIVSRRDRASFKKFLIDNDLIRLVKRGNKATRLEYTG